jgi:hypothetical protein
MQSTVRRAARKQHNRDTTKKPGLPEALFVAAFGDGRELKDCCKF